MNIGEVADRSGIPPKTIRYYEDIGLIRPQRSDNGYRAFRETDLHKLAFLGRARALGFSIEDCRVLSAQVKAIAEEHLSAIDHKIAQLREMRETLSHLVDACHGDHRPDCPILGELSGALASQG